MVWAGIGNIHCLETRIQNTDARAIKATQDRAARAGTEGRAAHAGLPVEYGTQAAATLAGKFLRSHDIDWCSVIPN